MLGAAVAKWFEVSHLVEGLRYYVVLEGSGYRLSTIWFRFTGVKFGVFGDCVIVYVIITECQLLYTAYCRLDVCFSLAPEEFRLQVNNRLDNFPRETHLGPDIPDVFLR